MVAFSDFMRKQIRKLRKATITIEQLTRVVKKPTLSECSISCDQLLNLMHRRRLNAAATHKNAHQNARLRKPAILIAVEY